MCVAQKYIHIVLLVSNKIKYLMKFYRDFKFDNKLDPLIKNDEFLLGD